MGTPTFSPLYIGLSGLQAMQEAESVVGNNIDNANTPGYAQESVNLVEGHPYPPVPGDGPMIGGQYGQGVSVQSVTRQDSWFYDRQDWQNQSTYQMYSTYSSILTQVQGILSEPSSNGIQSALDQFFSAWQTLSTDPSNTAARQAVITQGQVLAQTANTVTSQLQTLQSNVLSQINDQFQELEQYAQELSAVQAQIAAISQSNVGAGGASSSAVENPNELLDQQAAIIDEMSQLANLTLSQNQDGTISVSIGPGGSSGTVIPLNALTQASVTEGSNGVLVLSVGSGSNTQTYSLSSVVSGGQIAGNAQGFTELTGLLNNLNAFTSQLATQINSALGGQTFFDTSPFGVDVKMTSATLALGPGGPPGSSTYVAGDNTYAVNVVNLQTQAQSITWIDGSGNSQSATGTFDQLLASVVSQVGMTASGVAAGEKTADALLQQSSQLRQSISGVSIDEQASYMIAFQNAYAAAAKYIATFQTMLNALLNMVQP